MTKAALSQVKFKVRHNALLLGEFTVEQMVKATGLNPESVRTELQRMKKEGFLTSEPLRGEIRKRGGRPHIYRLTPDPEKRLALSRSVEAFYPAPSLPIPARPTSRHFHIAVQLLNQATKRQIEGEEYKALLDEAQYHLDFAFHEESGDGQGMELARAYINREQGRLEYLRGNDGDAERLFEKAREVFASADLPDEVAKVDEYLQSIQIRRRWMEMVQRGIYEPRNMLRCVLETLKPISSSLADRPLMLLLMNLLEHLVPSARELVLASSHETIEAMQHQITEVRESTRRIEIILEEQMGRVPKEERRLPKEHLELGEYTLSSLEVYDLKGLFYRIPRGREPYD